MFLEFIYELILESKPRSGQFSEDCLTVSEAVDRPVVETAHYSFQMTRDPVVFSNVVCVSLSEQGVVSELCQCCLFRVRLENFSVLQRHLGRGRDLFVALFVLLHRLHVSDHFYIDILHIFFSFLNRIVKLTCAPWRGTILPFTSLS